jgi:hypothetical protein
LPLLQVTAQVVGSGNPVSGRFSPMQARSSPEEQFNVVHAAYLAQEVRARGGECVCVCVGGGWWDGVVVVVRVNL